MTCVRGCCENQAAHYKSIQFDGQGGIQIDRQKFDRLGLYEKAVKEGSQPWSTKADDCKKALDESDRLGRPYRADAMGETYYPQEVKLIKELTKEQKEIIRKDLTKRGADTGS